MSAKIKEIRSEPVKDIRKMITDLLVDENVISKTFTGKIVLNFHRGGLNSSSCEIANPL